MESGAEDGKAPAADQRLASALTHPQRVRILAELRRRRMGPEELSGALGERFSKVAYHFKVLERLGGLAIADEADGGEDLTAS